jgi:integrase
LTDGTNIITGTTSGGRSPITTEDRRIFANNQDPAKARKPYKGSPELRDVIQGFKHAIVNRNFEKLTGSTIRSDLTLLTGLEEYLSVHSNLKEATIASYKHAVNTLENFSGDKPLYEYTELQFSKFITHLRKSLREASISIIMRSLNAIWNYFLKTKYIQENPVPAVKSPPVKPSPINKRDLDLILKELKTNHVKQHYQFVKFLVLTGMRPGSAIEQRWEWIDIERKFMQVYNVKASRMFVFPIDKELNALLSEIGVKISGKVFAFKGTDSLHFFPKVIKKLLDKAKNPEEKDRISRHYSLYNLRDTFASNMANSDTEMSVVQELMDHTDVQITRRHYVEIKTDFLRNKLERAREFNA